MEPQFASDVAVSTVGGFLRFPDGVLFRITAQPQCTDVCTVVASVALRIGSNWINADLADSQVTGGGLLPWSVYAASFAANEFVAPGNYAVWLDEIRPRDCEGLSEVTWSIEVAGVQCAPLCALTALYTGTSGTGRLGLSS